MKEALLDTDILSAFFRNNGPVVTNANVYLQQYRTLNFSIISYYEIMNGLLYKDANNQRQRFSTFSSVNNIIPLTIVVANYAANIFATLRKEGQPIGHTDSLIAGIALAHNLELITNNTAHFKRVAGLQINNWL